MEEYQPRPGFKRLAQTMLAQDLWAILNTRSAIAGMEEATDQGLPAVAGIDRRVSRRFREEVLHDKVKQMIKQMVRQIMEANGYVLSKPCVRSNFGLFIQGATYIRYQ